ncbi:SAM-dependent methyltransferase [Actinomadura viridis]|uniref:O-methyltransferase involved in polyketide biosynthesis n=1 Tax=Actinomadura viridis TaxID=58110 RepID=A0A931GHZ0_9ACTN|nr:SAM-dependent methyltransferase [Actinomadura viridis]MBG6087963.1 O-methyltransferase involved in polyketide biosynthesis [Actinomadura viridis]
MEAIDSTVPHSARIWDYWLGGKDHYPVDRDAGEMVKELLPDIALSARQDRAFLGRAVRHLAADAGIRQFLDLGTGLPTADNTHEVAQRVAPECRVVYVDNDPLVLTHARALLTSRAPEGVTDYVDADIRDVDGVLAAASRTLDLTRPVALMLLGVLNHIVDDGEALGIVHRLLEAVPSGSYLAISHTSDEVDGEAMHEATRQVTEQGGTPVVARSARRIAAFFDRVELLEPGVVSCSRWRPGPDASGEPPEVAHFCGMGRKP